MHSKLDIIWKTVSDINYQIQMVARNLKEIDKSASSIRTQHLVKRASAFNIRNRSSSAQKIINIQKLEQVIKMWRAIKYVTININNTYLKTVDISVDGIIKWSDIKKDKSLKFTTIDDEDQIEKLTTDGISNHPNQAEGTPLII